MKAENLAAELGLKKLTETGLDKKITGVFIGDLLSIVMSESSEGDAWITMQTHANILNVADLNELACVIIAGGITPDKSLVEKAKEAGVVLLASEMGSYDLAWRIHEALEGRM